MAILGESQREETFYVEPPAPAPNTGKRDTLEVPVGHASMGDAAVPSVQPTLSPTLVKDSAEGPVAGEQDLNQLQSEAARKQGSYCGVPKRLVLVLLSCLGLAISYADRSNIAIAIIPMSKEFGWDPVIEGAIFSCFFYGYLSTQILGGYISDKFGGKYVFATAALGWSVFTLITPFAARWHFGALIASRVLLGVAEGVSYPSINSLLGKWLPIGERARATSAVNSFSYAGAILALLVSAPMAASPTIGWPWVFYTFGAIGLVWLVPWMIFVRSSPPSPLPADSLVTSRAPRQGPEFQTIPPDPQLIGSPNAEDQHEANEKAYAQSCSPQEQVEAQLGNPVEGTSNNSGVKQRPVPWKKILTNSYTWAIIANQYCTCWGFFVLLQWMPTFYRQQFGVDLKDLGMISIVPYCVQFSVGLMVGFVADWLVFKCKVPLVYIRKGSQVVAMLGASLFMLLAGFAATNITQGVIFITCALGFSSISNVGVSVAHFDINPQFAGVIFSLGNTAATLTGIVGVQVTGLILKWTGSWALVFSAAAVHYAIGAITWLILAHPDKKIVLTP